MTLKRALQGITLGILRLLVAAEDASASSFTVTPIRVLLGKGTTSALLNVRNDSTDPIRFQISLKAWNLSPSGDMQLSDTNDLVYFPTIMELKPGEQRNVRIGSSFKAPVNTERSYRIYFEELPPPDVAKTDTNATGASVKVLTKMGVPIFIQPPNPVLKADISGVVVEGGKVKFDIRNVGNSFFLLTRASVTGMGKASSAPTFEKQQDGWYLLAGGLRHFEFDVPKDACATTDQIKVGVTTSLTDSKGTPISLEEQIPMTPAACAPSVGK